MFKKILFSLVAVLGLTTAATAGTNYAHDASVLPVGAQTTISNFFDSEVSVVNVDKDFGRISEYEVILSDGTEITFDAKGNWENVEVASNKAIPAAFVSHKIADYVKSNYADQRIVGIEKSRHNIEIELSNGIELKFDVHGNFFKVD